MKKYKLYKLTVEHTLVVAAESQQELEQSVGRILTVHMDSVLRDGLTNHDFEEIKSDGDLPDGWEPACLPYSKYSHMNAPEDLINKTIKELI